MLMTKACYDILWLRLGGFIFLDNDSFIGLCFVVSESSGRFNLQTDC